MATPQVPSTMKIYSSNLPDLFLFRHSEYNKHVRNLENYESDIEIKKILESASSDNSKYIGNTFDRKYLAKIEKYDNDKDIIDGLLISSNNPLHISSEEDRMADIWSDAQKRYYERHHLLLANLIHDANRGKTSNYF